jgi:hypothetical protein
MEPVFTTKTLTQEELEDLVKEFKKIKPGCIIISDKLPGEIWYCETTKGANGQ